MATNTYVPLATTTLGVASASVTFSNLDTATYRDFRVIFQGRPSSNAVYLNMRVNNDSTSGAYKGVLLYNGPNGFRTSNDSVSAHDVWDFNPEKSMIYDLYDAGVSGKVRTIITAENKPSGFRSLAGVHYLNTNAVSSLVFSFTSGNIQAGTTIGLYGLAG